MYFREQRQRAAITFMLRLYTFENAYMHVYMCMCE